VRGARIRRVRVTASDGRVKLTRGGGRFRARVDLRGIARRTVRVRIVVTTARGRHVTRVRTYRTCAKRSGARS
jgi:hypothetical protein